jgi:hypothetical protein
MSRLSFGMFASSGGIPGSFESIATIVANGTSDSITFNSIPAGYTHLQIRNSNS